MIIYITCNKAIASIVARRLTCICAHGNTQERTYVNRYTYMYIVKYKCNARIYPHAPRTTFLGFPNLPSLRDTD